MTLIYGDAKASPTLLISRERRLKARDMVVVTDTAKDRKYIETSPPNNITNEYKREQDQWN